MSILQQNSKRIFWDLTKYGYIFDLDNINIYRNWSGTKSFIVSGSNGKFNIKIDVKRTNYDGCYIVKIFYKSIFTFDFKTTNLNFLSSKFVLLKKYLDLFQNSNITKVYDVSKKIDRKIFRYTVISTDDNNYLFRKECRQTPQFMDFIQKFSDKDNIDEKIKKDILLCRLQK